MKLKEVKGKKNIMIHGIPENENEESDKEYIASFLQVLGTNVVPESATRLGRSENNSTETSRKKKSRPLKLSMKTVADKDQIMRRLSNLKNAEEKYKKVSVKDDYTLEEREIIKEWQTMANERNKAENTQQWKCRGNPKNGMRLVKIKKQEPEVERMDVTNAYSTSIQ